jgi:ribosome maturation protein Sdo1
MQQAYQVVRYKAGDTGTFEVLTKKGAALQFREGKLGFSNVLFADEIYTNHSKGERAKEADLLYVVQFLGIRSFFAAAHSDRTAMHLRV